ncbi:hypothetical protein HA052_22460 [Chromobacterium haemolyticum]|uniref:Uncharacterized protein n=1 Tax=Chromobacterium fluminis TaxID=3044269 RepID=A0ABX0LB04_9NEIS|nr:hypothetical protein [Chromobacterium haemolyticum]NHR07955.1 hypothetical protein [Chromobacterium haemolyticum]
MTPKALVKAIAQIAEHKAAVSETYKEYLATQERAREHIKSTLRQIDEAWNKGLRVDADKINLGNGTMLVIEEEWFDFPDPLIAVQIVKAKDIPTLEEIQASLEQACQPSS